MVYDSHMMWQLDPNGGEPAYQQIRRHFERLIVDGGLLPGQPLPTERQLAAQLGVNRSTITAAYNELRASGWIRSTPGSGTKVSDDVWGLKPGMPDWGAYASQGLFRPTLPLLRLLWDANRHPANINLARGEISPDLWPGDAIRTVIGESHSPLPLGYGDSRGEAGLRKVLAQHMAEEHGVGVSEDEILVTAGAQEGLSLIAHGLLKPGDAVAIEKPSYAYSLTVFASAGLRLFPLATDSGGLIPDEVTTLHRQHNIRMVFASPTYQNPTGTTVSAARRRRLIDVCARHRIPIVEDDAYGKLTLEGSPPPPSPLAALSSAPHQVIYVGTLSKTFAPGLRIGWITAPPAIISRLAGVKEQMNLGVSALNQVVAERILASGLWHQQRQKLQIALGRRQNAMVEAARRYLGNSVAFAPPPGGYHLWVKLNAPVADRALVETTLQHGVIVVPGSIYGAQPGFIRLTYACASEAQIADGIQRLAAALSKLQQN